MRIYSLNELLMLPRPELFQLYARTITALPRLPDGSFDRYVAQSNLYNLRRALTRPSLRPG